MIEQWASEVELHDIDILAIGATVGNLNAYPYAPAKTGRYGLDRAATGIDDELIVHASALAIAEVFGSVC